MNDKKKLQILPDDEEAVFVPAEDIRAIERVLSNWEQIKHEYCKMEAGKKTSNNEKSEN